MHPFACTNKFWFHTYCTKLSSLSFLLLLLLCSFHSQVNTLFVHYRSTCLESLTKLFSIQLILNTFFVCIHWIHVCIWLNFNRENQIKAIIDWTPFVLRLCVDVDIRRACESQRWVLREMHESHLFIGGPYRKQCTKS